MRIIILVALGSLLGCGEDTSAPGRVTLPLLLESDGASDLLTDSGYTVQLDQANLTLGAVRCYAGEPLFSRLWRAVAVGRAWAHPGHYQQGEALAEWLDGASVDLTAAATSLGTLAGVTGAYNSAQLLLERAEVRGSASDGARTVRFVATVATALDVQGIAVADGGLSVTTTTTGLVLRVTPQQWVRTIDFAALPDGTRWTELTPDSQAYNALYRGIYNTSAYAVEEQP